MIPAETIPAHSPDRANSARQWFDHEGVNVIVDAPRVGGITPFLKICSLADHKGLRMAPRFLIRRIFLIGSGIAFEHEPMGTLRRSILHKLNIDQLIPQLKVFNSS